MGGLQVDKRLKMPRFHSTHTHYMHTHCTYILWTHTCTHTVHTQTHCAYMHTNIHYVHTYTLCTYKHTLCTHSCVHTFYTHTTPMQGLLCHGSKSCFSEAACTLHTNAAVQRMSAFSLWVPLSESSSVPFGAQEAPVPVHRKWAGTTLIICWKLLEAENCFLHCSGSWRSGCLHGNSPDDSWWSLFMGLPPSSWHLACQEHHRLGLADSTLCY